MDKQIIFDVVLFGIRAQGGPSMNGKGCAYRSAMGRRCAVGMWIANDQYDPLMEGRTVLSITRLFPGKLPAWFQDHTGFLQSLQQAHDSAADSEDFFPEDFERRMRRLAEVTGLRYTHPEVPMPQAEEAYQEYCTH